jgi:hypothetical protein
MRFFLFFSSYKALERKNRKTFLGFGVKKGDAQNSLLQGEA